MRAVVKGKYQPFHYKLVNHKIKKITSFNLIGLHLQKKIILEMFIPTPTEYFRVKSGQEIDLAPVIAMNYVLEGFLIFLRFEQGGQTPRIRHL